MIKSPPRLHHLHNGRLHHVSPVLVDLLRDFVLVCHLRVFGLSHWHFDLYQAVLEGNVQSVCVVGLEILGVGSLGEDVDF